LALAPRFSADGQSEVVEILTYGAFWMARLMTGQADRQAEHIEVLTRELMKTKHEIGSCDEDVRVRCFFVSVGWLSFLLAGFRLCRLALVYVCWFRGRDALRL
jgi:hypothetical protein